MGLLLLTKLAERGEVAAAEGAFVAVEAEEGNVEGAILEERAGEDGVGIDSGGVGIDDGAHEFGLEGSGAVEAKLQLGKLADEERFGLAAGAMLGCEAREQVIENVR